METTANVPAIQSQTPFHHGLGVLTPEDVSRRARENLQRYIDQGTARAGQVVSRILTEVPTDAYVPAPAIKVSLDEGKKLFHALIADRPAVGIHQHALDQTAERIGFNTRFLHDLQKKGSGWANELAAHNFNELLQRRPKDRYLVRSVNGQLRGVLSDSFKRIDARPTVDALLGEAERAGATVVDGTYSDTRVALKVIHPEPVEVFPGEWAVLGFDYSNSDYGDGASEWKAFINRLLCLNGATLTTEFRRVHLGRRFDGNFAASQRTLDLDARTQASAAKDLVRQLLGKDAVDHLVGQIRDAANRPVTDQKIEGFLKTRVSKSEQEAVVKAYTSADIEEVPAGASAWRLSNAVSFVAKTTENARRKLALEELAGEALAV